MNFSNIDPAGEPKDRGGPACLAPVKQGFLHEAFTAQGFGQVSSPVLWLPRQFTLLCSTSLYTKRYLPLPCRREEIREKACRRYADIGNFAGSKRRCPGDARAPNDFTGVFSIKKFCKSKFAEQHTAIPNSKKITVQPKNGQRYGFVKQYKTVPAAV
ncbi:MAG: hypothetical protein LBI94_00885 [Treponema sp.]|nr:hypothetical protein [Treponema sp.]